MYGGIAVLAPDVTARPYGRMLIYFISLFHIVVPFSRYMDAFIGHRFATLCCLDVGSNLDIVIWPRELLANLTSYNLVK